MEERLTFIHAEVSMSEFARHRGQELAVLTQIVESGVDGSDGHSRGGSNKRVFQQLPRHMRRRAMSHNPKRVPRRLMEIHKREVEKFPKKESKRPSRRFRRRPKQLLQEYNRRQRNFIWLETHIWHAKRFKMVPRWKYKIPLYPSDKSWRACYHGSQRAALMQDLSYLCCIQLTGVREVLLEKLSLMTGSDCGLTFASVMSQRGNCECSCVVYRQNCYPYNAICPVTFFWRPNTLDEEPSLWLWCHPSAFDELLAELVSTLSVHRIPTNEDAQESANEKQLNLLKKNEFTKLAPKLTSFYERSPIYKNESVTLTVLKDTLVRFRIVGRWATAILTQTLHLANMDENHPQETRWWMKCNQTARDLHAKQAQFWDKLKDQPYSTQVSPGTIVGLVVCDPREQLPVSRCRIPPTMPEITTPSQCIDIPPQLSYSALWDQEVRDEVTFTKKTDAEINTLRANNLLPGTPISLGGESSRIPILLIQHSSSSTTSEVDAGWDLIIPAGWAMAFWIPLIYRGARAGGYRENRLLAHEFGAIHFPEEYPDTSAGKATEDSDSKEMLEKYFKYPPDKRPNYIKLGVATPFSFPWSRLVNEWASQAPGNNPLDSATLKEDFFVVRNKRVIRLLQQMTSVTDRKKRDQKASESILHILGPTNYSRALVACNLHVSSRGSLTKYALICKPCPGDVQRKSNDEIGELEPHHKDSKMKLRKAAKKQKTKASTPLEADVKDKLLSKDELFFPTPEQLISSCSKPIMGFVNDGQFSLSTGRFVGFGFVALVALVQLLNESDSNNTRPFMYVRSTHSFQYRAVSFNIL